MLTAPVRTLASKNAASRCALSASSSGGGGAGSTALVAQHAQSAVSTCAPTHSTYAALHSRREGRSM
eukprot:5222141-Prymnesium_polylepis.1